MIPFLTNDSIIRLFARLANRYRWLHTPAGLLMMLLQRTPALRVITQVETVAGAYAGDAIKGIFALAAMGAVNSVAGATVFNVTATPVAATPTSGSAKAVFNLTGATGTAMSIGVTVSGAPGNPKSYSITGTLPAGLSLTGAGTNNWVNVSAPYKMTITGTPTAAGSSSVTVTAWDGSGGTGGNSAKITLAFTLSGGVSSTAPSFTTQPASATVTAGSPASFTVAASGSPAPTYQWSKGGAAISGATSATYSIASAQVSDAGSYTVVATNSAGSATSNAATLTVNAAAVAPTITTQPANVTVTAGSPASFTVMASGSPAPTYQWSKGGAAISGATSATYSIASAQVSDAGSYTVVATNSAGSATSNAATLTVNAATVAPTITTQPANVTVTAGSAASFAVAASGSPAPTYQWSKGGAAISGATGATYSIASAQASDAGSYTVVATNSAGSVTSATASLTISVAAVAPTIVTQPASTTVTAGSAANFSVVAGGTAPFTYRWNKGSAAVSGATNATYSIASAQASDAGSYTVVVTNSVGSATSNAATLTVNAATMAPAITTQPASLTVTAGSAASFTVAASGSPTPTYQWSKGGAAISGATGATYSIASAQASDAGSYTVVATNSAGSATSNSATLTVNAAPSSGTAPAILTQPISETVATGHNVSFYSSANGSPSASYQWKVSTDGGATWSALTDSATYSGTTTNTLTVSGASTAMNGYRYQVSATNTAGSTTSNALTLTVETPPFPSPNSIAVDPAGNLVISDGSNNLIQVVSSSGVATPLAGSSGQQGSADGTGSAALFRQPGGLVIDAAGNIYVVDTGNSLIRKLTPSGQVTTLAGSASNQGFRDGSGTAAWFNSPSGVAIDSAGNLYVADTGNSVIREIAPAGAVTTLAGTAGTKGSADGAGVNALFSQPTGIALDSAGNLYVADTFNQTIRKITSAGVVSTFAGLAGVSGATDGSGANALFNHPGGLTVDGAGHVYVADTGNATVRVIASDGTVSTLAGLATIAGLKDGTGTEAWFNQPKDVRLDAQGNLYVTDNGNAAIRKISAGAVVSTLALTQGSYSSTSSSSSSSGSSGTPSTPVTTPSAPADSAPGKAGGGALEPGFALALAVVFLFGRRQRLWASGRG